ncbi:hypothetical protein [Cryptosporangium minutisporangium]|uniref:Uncharacterized protein n=1 Tax=Cryptosporangium minutisporangium TaxID=113569 RepID=A0ABP6SX85_9ACTN
MTELFARPFASCTPLTAPLQHGQRVHVNARHTWLPAMITVPGRTRIALRYADPRRQLAEWVPRWLVRPAEGVHLQPVRRLPAGASVVAFDGVLLEVAACHQNRHRWWVIHYTHGELSTVPPRAVLRIADPTPIVTVHGVPLDAATSPTHPLTPSPPPASDDLPLAVQKGHLR